MALPQNFTATLLHAPPSSPTPQWPFPTDPNATDDYGGSEGYPDGVPPNVAVDRLFPALLECFGTVLCGYAAGRSGLVPPSGARGLGGFVSSFALPALLFRNMVVLDFAVVSWGFLLAVLATKVAVFVLVCVVTLLTAAPASRFAKAGLFPIFATQSNDFALGYPIVQALYQATNPEYVQYIYLVAPISLVLLNPVGFVFCELQRRRNVEVEGPGEEEEVEVEVEVGATTMTAPPRALSGCSRALSSLRTCAGAVLGALVNPVVLSSLVGLAGNFLLARKVPELVSRFLDSLGAAFGASAQFYLGLSMVGKMQSHTRGTVVSIILLITAKVLVFPLLCREMVELLETRGEKNHTSLRDFGFLYGVFPTAPSVIIYASRYAMEIETLSTGMVVCTFLSAPLMYVSSWLLAMPRLDDHVTRAVLDSVSFDIGIVGLIFLVWVLGLAVLSRRYRQLPHFFSINLFAAQLLTCVGMVFWHVLGTGAGTLARVLAFILLYAPMCSSYLWTGMTAFSLLVLQVAGEKRTRSFKGMMTVVAWGLPAFAVGILVALSGDMRKYEIDPAFFWGRSQVVMTVVMLAVSILLGATSLIVLGRRSGAQRPYEALSKEGPESTRVPDDAPSPPPEPAPNGTLETHAPCEGECPCSGSECCASTRSLPVVAAAGDPADPAAVARCLGPCGPGDCALADEERARVLEREDPQAGRHVLLCLLLLIAMFLSMCTGLWWLLSSTIGGPYLEFKFTCAVCNFGQGFLSFVLFGLDKHLIIIPFKRRLQRLWGSAALSPSPRGPTSGPLRGPNKEVAMTCRQFLHFHRERCCGDIVHERRCGRRRVRVCLGSELVGWLVAAGLSEDRDGATRYAERLLCGGVIARLAEAGGRREDGGGGGGAKDDYSTAAALDFLDAPLYYRVAPPPVEDW
ncbi:lysosomal cholesterol signaling protein isoform X1 [Petromyzon marinus]|uniref:lysosomal cholesterol signaling protein isoform X1 n=1 Tax=Petromyzon marinus TaxID=7757 RepID=UPI003F6ECA58